MTYYESSFVTRFMNHIFYKQLNSRVQYNKNDREAHIVDISEIFEVPC